MLDEVVSESLREKAAPTVCQAFFAKLELAACNSRHFQQVIEQPRAHLKWSHEVIERQVGHMFGLRSERSTSSTRRRVYRLHRLFKGRRLP